MRKGVNEKRCKRSMTRFTSSKYYQDIIITDLTIMGNFFMLLKSQQDEGLMYYRKELMNTDKTNTNTDDKNTDKPDWNYVWDYIEQRPEYKNYLFKPTDDIIVKSAIDIQASDDANINSVINENNNNHNAAVAAADAANKTNTDNQ
jgi:hypothetical protein